MNIRRMPTLYRTTPVSVDLSDTEARQLLDFCRKYQRRESEFTYKLEQALRS